MCGAKTAIESTRVPQLMLKFALHSVGQYCSLASLLRRPLAKQSNCAAACFVMKSTFRHRGLPFRTARFFAAFILFAAAVTAVAQTAASSLTLSRAVHPQEFLPAVGMRAGLFGDETGHFEAWVYPLKILRDFHLLFHVDSQVLPAETLARTVFVRPESCTILYAGDTFQVRETLFVPVHEPGAVIVLQVETKEPLEIEAVFQRDFQLEWPAALGGSYLNWNEALRAFELGEEQKKYVALVGSPTATLAREEYLTNYSSSSESSFLLGTTHTGTDTKVIVLAGSVHGEEEAEETYHRLSSRYEDLLRSSADYYQQYLNRTVSVTLPDAQLQQAYDWSRISMVQGMVTNPYLGTGLIAGYKTSGTTQRPGFAWFFGRDALWTSLALNAQGDFADTRAALDFLSHYQRADGKVEHEISQAATLVPWFKDYPYAYAAADATPLYIVAMNDYVMQSGDVAFAREKWDSVWRAYQFLKSTYGPAGLPQNFGVGHGWVEGGPLLPVQTELYQSALGAEALHALSGLAHVTGKDALAKQLDQEFAHQKQLVEQDFWSPDRKIYSFALDKNSHRVEIPSVLATVPMWFGLLDASNSEAMIRQLADSDQETDWGMRIISSHDPRYNPGGYHFGSVWPLFTGWASVGEYRYHRALPAYLNLRANALMALDGSLGHVTEVLSGDYYQPLSTASPHQIWSAAMVVSPLLRGLFGLEPDAQAHRLHFWPHIPAGWESFELRKVRVGETSLDLKYSRTVDTITLEVTRTGDADCTVEFAPALSPRAQVVNAEINGRPAPVHVERNDQDQHAIVHFPVYGGPNTLRIRVRNDFALGLAPELPLMGEASTGLRILSQSWGPANKDVSLELAGIPGKQYTISVWNPAQIQSVEGADLLKGTDGSATLQVKLPGEGTAYVHGKVVVHFLGK
jgi:glycogen debranching enzyme